MHIINLGGPSGPPHFTIIITDQGYNNSKTHSLPWPVMNVAKNQSVTIHVENRDSNEPHGFAISHYFDAGVAVAPLGSYDLSFRATEAGTFKVYCTIQCSIHSIMIDGELRVK